jgi:formate dehydrogenase major subunit
VPKDVDPAFDRGQPTGAHFRPASWDEALDFAAAGLRRLLDAHGKACSPASAARSARNEEAWLFQKLVRTGFGSNNVDHCTRLCHASSVAALLEGVGSGAVSNPVRDVEHAAPTSPATPGACCSSMPTPTWPCSTRCCTSS